MLMRMIHPLSRLNRPVRDGLRKSYFDRARHFALPSARSFARFFQFGMLSLVFGGAQVFFVSFAMSRSGYR
jgi:hypothetical protein